MKQAVPTKSQLLQLKKNLVLATKGQQLMDRKKNILIREMMSLLEKVSAIRKEIETLFQEAYQSLQEANISLGNIENITKSIPIDDRIQLSSRNIMGVDLPVILYQEEEPKLQYGINVTNSIFDTCYLNFLKVKHLTIQLAEIDNSTYKLATAIKKAKKRSNALKNVVVPNLEKQIKRIQETLEEKEREEFSRFKVIKEHFQA